MENNYHEVKLGDSLTDISNKYGISIDKLIAINKIIDPNSLEIGTKLILKEETLEDQIKIEDLSFSKDYGPLTIKSTKFEFRKGRNTLKAKHKNGKNLTIAIDCKKKEIDVKVGRKRWQGWMPAQKDFEKKLVNDYC